MMKAATLTLNPCIDKTLYFPTAFETGILNRVENAVTGAGGKGINVTRMLRRLGVPDVAAFGFAGGLNGRLLHAMLSAEGIATAFSETAAETRTCTKLIDAIGICTEANEAGGPVTGAEYTALQKRLLAYAAELSKDGGQGWFFAGGSIPAGLPKSVYREIMLLLGSYPIRFVLDADGEALRLGLEGHPYLIKPNEAELEELIDAPISDRGTAEKIIGAAKAARKIFMQYGCRVLCTFGADGALYTHDEGAVYVNAPRVPTLSFAGAGDTFLAAFVFMLERGGGDAEAALRFASATAAAKVALAGNEVPDKAQIVDHLDRIETKVLGI